MKKFFSSLAVAAATLFPATVVAFASSGGGSSATVVDPSTYADVLTAMTGQISVTTIVGVLAAAIGASIGFVFLWWGVRKLMSTFFSGFRKGKASV